MASAARLEFADTARIDEVVAHAAQVEEQVATPYLPRAPRQRTLIRAIMRAPGISGHEVIVRNVSERGMRVSARGLAPHVGETLIIILSDGLEVEAEVRWVKGDEFGVALFAELDLQRLGLTNQRRHAAGSNVIHWLVDERLRRPEQRPTASLRYC